MASADNSYVRLMTEFRRHDNYDSVFRSCIDQLVGKVDLSSVKSCLALGTGCGEHEIYFARRLLPNLRTFTAVEPDHESVNALRRAVDEGQLPGVETTIVESTMEDCDELKNDIGVDAVLLFNVLFHVTPEDRQALFQKLMSRTLNPDGVVVIVQGENPNPCDGYVQVLQRLGAPLCPRRVIVADILAAGFQLVHSRDIVAEHDLSNASEDAVRFLEQHLLKNRVGFDQVRAAIDDVYDQPKNVKQRLLKLAVFKK